MATETVENYLKAIYRLCRESPAGEAAMSHIAALVGVTTGTATSMVKKLAAAKLARYERFGGVTLTPKGEKAAVNVLRRHRLIESFLVQTLKIDWADIHEEAERLEHAISPRILERLDEFLGHPATDPHGDPIPDANGSIREPGGKPLSTYAAGSKVHIVRIADQDRAFLLFIAKHGLKPTARTSVLAVDAQADSMLVQSHDHPAVSLSKTAAAKVFAEHAK